jgi:pimeloyl-ACP methyl ester carboxylesterase
MPLLEINATKIHYVDVDRRTDPSTGLPLVFIHGAGSSHFCWSFQLVKFSQTNRCIAIDLSGHGKSDSPNTPASIEYGYAHEVAHLINYLDLQEFILIGHSMGGGVALSYILHKEFRLPKALVLVDSSPDLHLRKVTPGLIIEAIEEQGKLRQHTFEEYAQEHDMVKYEEVMKHVDAVAMQRDLLACNEFDVTDRLNEIDIPIFALVGEKDDVITPSIVKIYVEKLLHADLAVVRGADHVPMIEQPEEFNRLFRKFISWVQKTE